MLLLSFPQSGLELALDHFSSYLELPEVRVTGVIYPLPRLNVEVASPCVVARPLYTCIRCAECIPLAWHWGFFTCL